MAATTAPQHCAYPGCDQPPAARGSDRGARPKYCDDPDHNPLLGAPNLFLTPHVAWASLAARRRLMDATARNVEAFLAGRPINLVS